jgi:hypothetical protein
MEAVKIGAGTLFLIILGTSIWVFFDATALGVRRGIVNWSFLDMGPGRWFIACLLLWIVVFPLYLSLRPKFKKFAIEEEAAQKKPARR